MNFRVELWSDLKCVSGSARLAVVDRLQDIDASFALDNNDQLRMSVPRQSDWLATTRLRQVLRVTDMVGRVTEWRIRTIDDTKQAGAGALVDMTARPIIHDLGACGPMWRPDIGTRRGYNLGGDNLLAENYIATFVLPFLSDEGIAHFATGTMDFDDPAMHRLSLAWQLWTPLQLLNELAELLGGELEIRRNGDTNYLIDIVVGRNSGLSQLLLRPDRNLRWIQRNRRSDSLKTVILPFGKIPVGDYEQATLGYNDWLITAINSTTLTLAGEPFLFDDQVNGKYVLKKDASRVQITDTIAPNQIVVSSATGLAVNDQIQIVANADGDQLTELTNPVAVALFGRVVGSVSDGDARGERNHVPNGFANLWTPGNQAVNFGQFSGDHSAVTTLNLKNLPAGLVISAGDVFMARPSSQYTEVSSGGTVSGAGTLTITVGSAISAGADDYFIISVVPPVPAGWSKNDSTNTRLNHKQMDPSKTGSPTGAINGAVSQSLGVIVDGLTAGVVIQAGDILEIGSTPTRRVVRGPATADGSGVARVALGQDVSANDNDAVTVKRADMTASPAGANAVFLPVTNTNNYIRSPDYTILADPELPPVWCSCGFDYYSPASASTSQSGTYVRPRLQVFNSSGPTLIATLEDVNQSLSAGVNLPVTLIQEIALTANTQLHLRFRPITSIFVFGNGGEPHIYLRYFQIHIGSDPSAPGTPDSHANRLWRLANTRLEELSSEPFTLQARLVDLAALNPDLMSEALAIGQRVRVMISDMAGGQVIDVSARITGYRWFMDPLLTEVTIETIPPRLTKAISKATARRLFVNVNVGGEQAVVPATEELPVLFDGSLRALNPAGQDPGTGAKTIVHLPGAFG